ncbi:hypothetical protein B0H11DRAFT_2257343 [Mycena galericulata]|nr:hypothetical protein B0H11DRAFT_2257343 [Mycena galericulata]
MSLPPKLYLCPLNALAKACVPFTRPVASAAPTHLAAPASQRLPAMRRLYVQLGLCQLPPHQVGWRTSPAGQRHRLSHRLLRPFTSLWEHDGQLNSWAAFSAEKAALLTALRSIPYVVIFSGDRHEFASIEFTAPPDALGGHTAR